MSNVLSSQCTLETITIIGVLTDVVLSFSGILVMRWLRKRTSHRGTRFLTGARSHKYFQEGGYNMFGNEKNTPNSKPDTSTPMCATNEEDLVKPNIVVSGLLQLIERCNSSADIKITTTLTRTLALTLNQVIVSDLMSGVKPNVKKLEELQNLTLSLGILADTVQNFLTIVRDVMKGGDNDAE